MTWYHGNDFYVQTSVEFTKLDFDLSRNIIYQIAALEPAAARPASARSPGLRRAATWSR
jgi:hypothetical protein